MPRPKECRRVAGPPGCVLFKPAGVPAKQLREVVLGIDEMEAVRLADLEELYHEQAAQRMNVSRPTFGRIVSAARKKMAQALVQGLALRIEGGEIEIAEQRMFVCLACGHEWQLPFGTGRPNDCPQCASTRVRRSDGRGGGRGGGGSPSRGRARKRGKGGGRGGT